MSRESRPVEESREVMRELLSLVADLNAHTALLRGEISELTRLLAEERSRRSDG